MDLTRGKIRYITNNRRPTKKGQDTDKPKVNKINYTEGNQSPLKKIRIVDLDKFRNSKLYREATGLSVRLLKYRLTKTSTNPISLKVEK